MLSFPYNRGPSSTSGNSSPIPDYFEELMNQENFFEANQENTFYGAEENPFGGNAAIDPHTTPHLPNMDHPTSSALDNIPIVKEDQNIKWLTHRFYFSPNLFESTCRGIYTLKENILIIPSKYATHLETINALINAKENVVAKDFLYTILKEYLSNTDMPVGHFLLKERTFTFVEREEKTIRLTYTIDHRELVNYFFPIVLGHSHLLSDCFSELLSKTEENLKSKFSYRFSRLLYNSVVVRVMIEKGIWDQHFLQEVQELTTSFKQVSTNDLIQKCLKILGKGNFEFPLHPISPLESDKNDLVGASENHFAWPQPSLALPIPLSIQEGFLPPKSVDFDSKEVMEVSEFVEKYQSLTANEKDLFYKIYSAILKKISENFTKDPNLRNFNKLQGGLWGWELKALNHQKGFILDDIFYDLRQLILSEKDVTNKNLIEDLIIRDFLFFFRVHGTHFKTEPKWQKDLLLHKIWYDEESELHSPYTIEKGIMTEVGDLLIHIKLLELNHRIQNFALSLEKENKEQDSKEIPCFVLAEDGEKVRLLSLIARFTDQGCLSGFGKDTDRQARDCLKKYVEVGNVQIGIEGSKDTYWTFINVDQISELKEIFENSDEPPFILLDRQVYSLKVKGSSLGQKRDKTTKKINRILLFLQGKRGPISDATPPPPGKRWSQINTLDSEESEELPIGEDDNFWKITSINTAIKSEIRANKNQARLFPQNPLKWPHAPLLKQFITSESPLFRLKGSLSINLLKPISGKAIFG